MIQISMKLSGGIAGFSDPKVSLNDDGFLTLGQERMEELGDFAIRTVKARVAKGIGSDGGAMPALRISRRAGVRFKVHGVDRQLLSYAQWKTRHGLQPLRDLAGAGKDGGHMMDNLSVRTVSGSSVTMAFTSQKAKAKAWANEKRAPFLGFAPEDTKLIVAQARKLFETEVEAISQGLAGYLLRRRRAA